MSSKLQLDVCHIKQWWRHLVNAYGIEAGKTVRSIPERLECEPVYSDTTQLNLTQLDIELS